MSAPVLALRAHAKLNLALRVHGRRPDGYHELDTWFAEIELHDELWATRAEAGEITLELESAAASGMPVDPGADNLVARAARAFAGAVPAAPGFRFHLRKHVPAGAGLGGGSSDAAAALRLCNALSTRPLPPDELRRLAQGLGADVPFFLIGGQARGRGIGEHLTPLRDPPHLECVLVLPPFGTSTARVFGNLGARLIGDSPTTTLPESATSPSTPTPGMANDLEPAAMRLYPELAGIRAAVADVAPDVRMSGSGSTLFVARRDAVEVDALAARLRDVLAGRARVVRTATLPRRACPAAAEWPGDRRTSGKARS